MSGPHQLPLALQLESFARFGTFVAADGDEAAKRHVRAVADGTQRAALWLHGESGTGKTHLLQAACQAGSEAGLRVMYVPLRSVVSDDLLAGLEHIDLLALDDIDVVAGRPRWETRLFSLFDESLGRQSTLLAGASRPPLEAGFMLPDLASRAAAMVVYRLESLDEAGCQQALMAHAAGRGLQLDETAARFLLHRVRRDMPEICRWLQRIDQAALAAQTRLTIPLIRRILSAADDERA
jgi:DnaA family protein